MKKPDPKEAMDHLVRVLRQACEDDLGVLDSHALEAYADAFRWLAQHGYVKIDADWGKRVLGQWLPDPPQAS